MSRDTAVVVVLVGAALVAWIVNLVRQNQLYVGYGVIFGLAISTAVIVIGLPPLVGMGALFRAHREALIVAAATFLIVILVYALGQLTILSNRLTRLTQELAIRGVDEPAPTDGNPENGPS